MSYSFQSEEFATEADKESDMHFTDNDKHDLPSDVKKVEDQQKPDPPIFPNQAFLAKTIIERIAQILENNNNSKYKLWPLLEQCERSLTQAELDHCYTDFEFVIYTAISNMLEEQTAVRMMDRLSEVFPPSMYNKSSWKTLKEKAQKHVKKYINTSLESHRELMKRVKSNPRKLFLIVADEAHVAITKKEDKKQGSGTSGERETETANDTMVNYWKDDEHPNVVVLQVRNIITDRVRSTTGGYVFTGVCLLTVGGGVTPPGQARGYPGQIQIWGGYPGQDQMGGTPARSRWGTPPSTGQQMEYLIHRSRYASCVHAGGLSCCSVLSSLLCH